jgi:predicted dehydrogenase
MINCDSCKVAFVGAGYMTTEHIKAFKDVPGVALAGIHSRTQARAEALALESGVATVCGSISELYDKTQAALVVISVPELSVGDVCLEAFKYPWACLIEKPAGYDVTDAEQILYVAQQLGRQAYVALNRRQHSSTHLVLKEMNQCEGVRLIHVYDQQDQIAARIAGQPELVVKNWMYANSIHLVDYFNTLGRGNIVSVTPVIHWNPDNPQFVMAKLTYDSGDIGIYEAVWNAPGPWAVTVTTQEKRWEMRPLEQAMVQPHGSRKLDPIKTHEWDHLFKPGLRLQAEEAVKAAMGQPSKLATLDDAMKSMKLVQAIYGNGY